MHIILLVLALVIGLLTKARMGVYSVQVYSRITVPGKVRTPPVSTKRYSWLNLDWMKKISQKFVTLAGGCATEESTLPPLTVSHIF
jgi:hypothetical protein